MSTPSSPNWQPTAVKEWELAFDRPDMVVSFMNHAFAKDSAARTITVFTFAKGDLKNSTVVNLHNVIVCLAGDEDPLELRFICRNPDGRGTQLLYLLRSDPPFNMEEHSPRVMLEMPKDESGQGFLSCPSCEECKHPVCVILETSMAIHRFMAKMNQKNKGGANPKAQRTAVFVKFRRELSVMYPGHVFVPGAVPECFARLVRIYFPDHGTSNLVTWNGIYENVEDTMADPSLSKTA